MTILSNLDFIVPTWPAPERVQAIQTTRAGGVSDTPYESLNVGDHVNDSQENVAANRALIRTKLPSEPVWMRQVHGTHVVDAASQVGVPTADAAYSFTRHAVCTVMTADCLPLLVCDRQGTAVAAIHAGWRGLLAGVIESTLNQMQKQPEDLMVWFGPAIGPDAFEVGEDVYGAFVGGNPATQSAFKPHTSGKWLADIYQLARQRLRSLGVETIYGGEFCTYQDERRFFSYRRDGVTGRMATMIWLA